MRRAAAALAILAACSAPPGDVTITKTKPRPDARTTPWAAQPTTTTSTTTTTEAPVRVKAASVPRPPADLATVLACIRRWESGGNYQAVSPSGKYRGAYQFDASTWAGAVTRAGYPEWANDRLAPPPIQDAAAAQLYSERGLQPWPTPARRCA